MLRREFVGSLAGVVAVPWLFRAWMREGETNPMTTRTRATGQEIAPLEKSDAEWKKLLDKNEYHILFEEGTERSFTSPLNEEKRTGTYICAACFLPLFSSETKFESGTGWPSFYAPIEGRIATKRDFKLILPRTEYHCVRCGGHQGHIFKDGPDATGLRHCNNGLGLEFVPESEDLPELRT